MLTTMGEFCERLRNRFGDRLSTAEAIRTHHATGVTYHKMRAPDAVLFAGGTEDVASAVALCHEHRVPVVPFGTGTSTEGQIGAVYGGLCIDLSRMNRVLRVSGEDMDCTVEAGVTRNALNAHTRDTGLFFPIDPGADASLGGMASTRASGTNAVRYGTMKDNVLALKVVTANGEIIETAGRARKSSAGYDLTRLFIGAEGTLGVITEVTLKLHPQPEHVAAAVCSFPTLRGAVATVVEAIQTGIPLARAELLDDVQVAACNRYSKLSLKEQPTLFLEFHGSPSALSEQIARFDEISSGHGGSDFTWAERVEDRTRLWKARHDVWWAALAIRPGSQGLPTDVCVPISRLVEMIEAARRDVIELRLTAPMCGHIGDGNFHLCVVIDPADADEMRRVGELNSRMIARAIDAGGTSTGEHGIGTGKMEFLKAERVNAMRMLAAVKRALDPRNIMNPGKVLMPDDYAPYT